MTRQRASRLQRPDILGFTLFLYGATVPLDILPLLGTFSAGTLFSPAVLVVAIIAHVSGHRVRSASTIGLALLLAVFLMTMTASVLWAPPSAPSFSRLVGLFQASAIFIALLATIPDHRQTALWGFTCGQAALAAALVIGGEMGENLRLSYGGVDENVTAYVLSAGVAGCITLLKRTRQAIILIPITAALSPLVILTGSRTGVLALIAVALTPLLMALFKRKLLQAIIGSIIAAGAILIFRELALNWSETPERITPILEGSLTSSSSGRGQISELYFARIDEWWALGVGYYGSAEFLGPSIAGVSLFPHNTLLKVWVEGGVIALLAFAGLFGLVCVRTLRGTSSQRWFVMLMPTLLFSMTLGGLEQTATFWFTFAICLADTVPSQPHDRDAPGTALSGEQMRFNEGRRLLAGNRPRTPGAFSTRGANPSEFKQAVWPTASRLPDARPAQLPEIGQ